MIRNKDFFDPLPDKESLGNDADFVAAIKFGNLDKAVTKAAADTQELINLRADLNDPKNGVDILNKAEKLICEAKGQINKAAIIQLVGRPAMDHKTKGKDLRA